MLTRMHHFILAARDAEKATDTWCRLFDLDKPAPKIDARGFRSFSLPLGMPYLNINESVGNAPIARFIEQKGEGFFCASLEEDDLEGRAAWLRAKGVDPVPESPRPGFTYYFLRTRDMRGAYYNFTPPGDQRPVQAPGHTFVRRITGFAHAVWNADEAASLYDSLLGLRPDSRGVAPIPGTDVRQAALVIGPDLIEVVAPTNRDSQLGRYLEKRGEGFYSLKIQVKDLAAAMKNLQAKGARVNPGETTHNAWLHPKDTHGILIELTET